MTCILRHDALQLLVTIGLGLFDELVEHLLLLWEAIFDAQRLELLGDDSLERLGGRHLERLKDLGLAEWPEPRIHGHARLNTLLFHGG